MPAVTIIVEFETIEGKSAEFERIMLDHARRTLHEEPGCLRFEVIRPVNEAGTPRETALIVNELYADDAAVAAHRANPRMGPLGDDQAAPQVATPDPGSLGEGNIAAGRQAPGGPQRGQRRLNRSTVTFRSSLAAGSLESRSSHGNRIAGGKRVLQRPLFELFLFEILVVEAIMGTDPILGRLGLCHAL